MNKSEYIYIDGSLTWSGLLTNDELGAYTERHKIELKVPELSRIDNLEAVYGDSGANGVVVGMNHGYPERAILKFSRQVIHEGGKVFYHWPKESAVEVIDNERVTSYYILIFVVAVHCRMVQLGVTRIAGKILRRLKILPPVGAPVQYTEEVAAPVNPVVIAAANASDDADSIFNNASPVPLAVSDIPTEKNRLPGCGVYLRLDFWAKISSGGSYGHTCYIAKELAATTERFTAFMANEYDLLDELGVHQVEVPYAPNYCGEEKDLVMATESYVKVLRPALAALRPAYIYERICLGNYTSAKLSLDLSIPYIVEYNGSEIAMKRSFDGNGYEYEDFYLKAEMAAFAQATAIVVVSDPVKEDLVGRGIDPAKILVNPNGADTDEYSPPTQEERKNIREKLGFTEEQTVIGFTGTFGGWHGVDALAEAIPRTVDANPDARYLLIGDGSYKHIVDEEVKKHGLWGKVVSVGSVPQREGARLLKACDIFLSPHNKHMVNSRFFGSPTKLFEYMAVGGGIVASDLEQIGECLTPALRNSDLTENDINAGDRRAILCEPGDVDQLVEATNFLVNNREVCMALGANARTAAIDKYSWRRNVERVWGSFCR